MGNGEPSRVPAKDAIGETTIVFCAIKDQSAKNLVTGSLAITDMIENHILK